MADAPKPPAFLQAQAAAAAAFAAAAACGGDEFPIFPPRGALPPILLPEPAEVLTPEEVASFLRIQIATVLEMATNGRIPCRKIGAEWRFLKAALVDWLRQGDTTAEKPPQKSSKERMLALAGAWKDDPTVDAMMEEIERNRKANPVGGR